MKKHRIFCMYGKLSITRFFWHLAIFNICFCCRLMNTFLTQFWTEKLLIHKPQPRPNHNTLHCYLTSAGWTLVRSSDIFWLQNNHISSVHLIQSLLDGKMCCQSNIYGTAHSPSSIHRIEWTSVSKYHICTFTLSNYIQRCYHKFLYK